MTQKVIVFDRFLPIRIKPCRRTVMEATRFKRD